jgi:hypothetical protein
MEAIGQIGTPSVLLLKVQIIPVNPPKPSPKPSPKPRPKPSPRPPTKNS